MMQWVIYIDIDAFYLSCELTRHPDLTGRPAIVAHDPKDGEGRGVVLSASYEARSLGFRSAMPVKLAWKMREKVSWLQPDFGFYESISTALMTHLKSSFPLARTLSIDEAAFLTDPIETAQARALAGNIQSDIRERFHLPSSIGVAPSLSVAKIASDRAKPGGIVVVKPDDLAAFLAPLSAKMVPGIGPVSAMALKAIGIETIGDAKGRTIEDLKGAVGSMATTLLELASGHSPVEPWPEETPPLSLGAMVTFDTDLFDGQVLLKEIQQLTNRIGILVRERSREFRSVTLRLKWGDLRSEQRSRTFSHHTDSTALLGSAARGLLLSLLKSGEREKWGVRTLGLTVHDLRNADRAQKSLSETTT